MKKFYIIILLFFFCSCATVNNKKSTLLTFDSHKNLETQLLKKLPKEENPDNFSKKFPTSPIILNSIIEFYKDYPLIYISDNITDFAIGKNEIALLKNNRIELVNNNCHSFILDSHNPLKIEYSDYVLAVFDKKYVNLFNLETCNKFFKLRLKWNFFKFSKKYYFFSNGKNFEIYKYNMLIPLIKGSFDNKLITAKFTGDYLNVLDSKGQILKFNLKKLTLDNITRSGFNAIKGVITDNNSIFLTDNNSLILNVKTLIKLNSNNELIFSKNSVDFFHNNHFILPITRNKINIHQQIDSFAKYGNFIFFKYKDSLNAIYLKKLYKKKIILRNPILSCKVNNGSAIFYDLNFKILKKGKNIKSCKFINGNFVDDNNTIICNFSKKVAVKDNITMYKRDTGANIFYFFYNTTSKIKNNKEILPHR